MGALWGGGRGGDCGWDGPVIAAHAALMAAPTAVLMAAPMAVPLLLLVVLLLVVLLLVLLLAVLLAVVLRVLLLAVLFAVPYVGTGTVAMTSMSGCRSYSEPLPWDGWSAMEPRLSVRLS